MYPILEKILYLQVLCVRTGIKIVFEGNTCIVCKSGTFVRKGYSCDGMYKLSIMNNEDMNSTYIVKSFDIWHARLAHLNFRSLKYMSKQGLISCIDEKNDKCEIWIQAKLTKKPFPKAKRNTQIWI